MGWITQSPSATGRNKKRVFTDLLMLSMPVIPVVLHVRDKDPYASDLYLRCLKILKANVAPTSGCIFTALLGPRIR